MASSLPKDGVAPGQRDAFVGRERVAVGHAGDEVYGLGDGIWVALCPLLGSMQVVLEERANVHRGVELKGLLQFRQKFLFSVVCHAIGITYAHGHFTPTAFATD